MPSSGSTPTASISASPSTITSGNSSTLTWSSTNATSCTASGAWSGSKATSAQSVSPTSTATYNLSCTGTNGTANNSATVTVNTGGGGGAPTFTSFTPASGPIGTVVTITGTNLNNVTIVEFNQGGTVSFTVDLATQIHATVPSGSVTGYISLNQGQAVSSQPFTVTAGTTPTITLSPTKSYIYNGNSLSLTWSSTNATSCTASGAWSGTKATSGSQSISPTTTSTYTLSCTGAGGSSSQSVTPTVYKAGDATHNGSIDVFDLSTLLSNYATTNAACDFSGNNIVDVFDLSILLSNYGG